VIHQIEHILRGRARNAKEESADGRNLLAPAPMAVGRSHEWPISPRFRHKTYDRKTACLAAGACCRRAERTPTAHPVTQRSSVRRVRHDCGRGAFMPGGRSLLLAAQVQGGRHPQTTPAGP